MIDWKRLGLAVLCTAILLSAFGVCILLAFLPDKVLFALAVVAIIVCMIIPAFYKALGEVSDKDKDNE